MNNRLGNNLEALSCRFVDRSTRDKDNKLYHVLDNNTDGRNVPGSNSKKYLFTSYKYLFKSEMFLKLVLVVAILSSESGTECNEADNITNGLAKTTISQDDSGNLSVLLTTGNVGDNTYRLKSDYLNITTAPIIKVRSEYENQSFTEDEQVNETSSRNETASNKSSNNIILHNEEDIVENTVNSTTISPFRMTTTSSATTTTTAYTSAATTTTSTTSSTTTTYKTANSTVSGSDYTTVPENKQNDIPVFGSFNLNYLYFLLLIIPIVGIAIGIYCFHQRKQRTKNAETTTRYNKPRKFSTPSWVFSEPDDADEEVITLEEEKRL